ncbi:MAG: TRAP transporter small permease [Pseudomonadota bacterium]
MLFRLLDRLVEGAAVLAFAASSVLICINVVNRYAVLGGLRKLAQSFEWLQPYYISIRNTLGDISVMADEVPGYLLVWVSFLGAYLALRKGGHISFDLIVDSLRPRLRSAVKAINLALISAFLGVMAFQSVRMIRTSGRTEIETAEIAQGWFMLILPIAAVLLFLALVRAQIKTHDTSAEP